MTDLTEEMLEQRARMARERYEQRGEQKPLVGYDWFLSPFNLVCVVPFGKRMTAVTACPRRRRGTFFQWEQIILPEVTP